MRSQTLVGKFYSLPASPALLFCTGSPSLEPRAPSEAARRSFQWSTVYRLPRPLPRGKRQPIRGMRTLHHVHQTKPDSHAGSWPWRQIRISTFPAVSDILHRDPLHAHAYTLIFTKRNDKGIHFTSIQDDDDIAGSAFHLDRWALLNLANSLFRSIST